MLEQTITKDNGTTHRLINSDFFDVKDLPVVDMILTDLPYNTTSCKWDKMLPLDLMWEKLLRNYKSQSAIVLFGQEPFSSKLRLSNLDMYKYDWYWRKSRPSGFTNAKLKPLKDIENIHIFSDGKTANGSKINMVYNPQGLEDCDVDWSRPKVYMDGENGVNPSRKSHKLNRKITKKGYPRQVLDFSNSNHKNIHSTQKPIDLLRYLIRTYTNVGDTVLDFTAGSMSLAVACYLEGRNSICIEKDKEQYMKSIQWVQNATQDEIYNTAN